DRGPDDRRGAVEIEMPRLAFLHAEAHHPEREARDEHPAVPESAVLHGGGALRGARRRHGGVAVATRFELRDHLSAQQLDGPQHALVGDAAELLVAEEM